MQVVGSYGVRIRDSHDALKRTADLFSDAVAYLVRPALENWDALCEADGAQMRQILAQSITDRHFVCRFYNSLRESP